MYKWQIESPESLQGEQWKPVDLMPGFEVSNFCRYRNALTGKIKHQFPMNKKYMVVKFGNKRFLAHRLFAMAWIKNPNPLEYNQVNHIDCDKRNNCLENLEWVNNSLNQLHAVANGKKIVRGNDHKLSKITEDVAKQIIAMRSVPRKEICKMFGVSIHIVKDIRYGRAWSHLPR